MSLRRERSDPPLGLLSEFGFGLEQQVGKWETCFWFSTFPRRVGTVGMWESQRDFQGLWKEMENPPLVFLAFHNPSFPPVLPDFHYALRLLCRLAKSLRLAACMSIAACVSVRIPAMRCS